MPKETVQLDQVIIRFAGDSGDGMQLTGGQFTLSTALAGNDLATFPDFPAEIRAPAGTLAGVSGFQLLELPPDEVERAEHGVGHLGMVVLLRLLLANEVEEVLDLVGERRGCR